MWIAAVASRLNPVTRAVDAGAMDPSIPWNRYIATFLDNCTLIYELEYLVDNWGRIVAVDNSVISVLYDRLISSMRISPLDQ